MINVNISNCDLYNYSRGVKYEIKGVIESFVSKYPQLLIFLTGGNDFDFDTRIKKRIFVDKYLVLRGLNRVLKELII